MEAEKEKYQMDIQEVSLVIGLLLKPLTRRQSLIILEDCRQQVQSQFQFRELCP